MIHDVDEALRTLIEHDVLNGSDVDVVFDAPTTEWASRRTGPTLDVYLYDIREDTARRTTGAVPIRQDGIVTAKERPPRFYRLSYLITAWTQRPEDEHRLLSAVLTTFIRFDMLPPDIVGGPLREMGIPVGFTIAYQTSEDRSLSDIWSALGGELKPSLDLVINTPAPLQRIEAVAPPVLETPRIELSGRSGDAWLDDWTTAEVSRGGIAASANRQGGRVVRVRDKTRDEAPAPADDT